MIYRDSKFVVKCSRCPANSSKDYEGVKYCNACHTQVLLEELRDLKDLLAGINL